MRPCVNNAHLNAQELLSKSGVPHTDISHGTGDEEVRATGGEYDVVHAGEVAGTAQLRFHVHRYPVPVAKQKLSTQLRSILSFKIKTTVVSYPSIKVQIVGFSDDFTVQSDKVTCLRLYEVCQAAYTQPPT